MRCTFVSLGLIAAIMMASSFAQGKFPIAKAANGALNDSKIVSVTKAQSMAALQARNRLSGKIMSSGISVDENTQDGPAFQRRSHFRLAARDIIEIGTSVSGVDESERNGYNDSQGGNDNEVTTAETKRSTLQRRSRSQIAARDIIKIGTSVSGVDESERNGYNDSQGGNDNEVTTASQGKTGKATLQRRSRSQIAARDIVKINTSVSGVDESERNGYNDSQGGNNNEVTTDGPE